MSKHIKIKKYTIKTKKPQYIQKKKNVHYIL